MAACPIPPVDGDFAPSVLAFVDCQAQSLGAGGYQALLGSSFPLVLTGLLTLFVAFHGYRMLVGHAPDMRQTVFGFLKLGFVLALATSWPSYRTLAYDVAMRAPAELAAEIGVPNEVPGSDGSLVERMATADKAMAALSVLGAGQVPFQPTGQPFGTMRPPPPFAGFEAFALGGSRLLFLLGAVGALAVARLTAGLMLALGPFFIAFLLFDGTRGLFVGWVRVLAGAALAAFATTIAIGLELALLEPWLAEVLTRRMGEEPLPSVPAELLLLVTLFTIVIIALVAAAARLAFAFRLDRAWPAFASTFVANLRASQPVLAASAQRSAAIPAEARSRAAAIADSIATTQRRETAEAMAGRGSRVPGSAPQSSGGPAGQRGADPVAAATAPLGTSFRRRSRGRVSAAAGRRDRTA